MFKPVLVTTDQFQSAPAATDESTVNNVFKVLHASYGNLFLSKFATGVTDAKNRDMGVASARKVWAHTLAGFDDSLVLTALDQCLLDDPKFPPTLPQFIAQCRACMPRKVYRAELSAPAVDRAEHAQKARELLSKIRVEKPQASGLDLLKQAIADAVRCAGGDEGAELARLDRMFPLVTA